MSRSKTGLLVMAAIAAAALAAPSARAAAMVSAADGQATKILAATAATPKTIYEIRDAIKAANDRDQSGAYEGIIPFLADRVEAVHEPRFPNDGFVDGKQMAKSLPYEHRVHDAMMQNRKMDVTFTVRGNNEILVKGQMTGKLLYDGSQLVHPVNMVWTFDNGRLVKIWVDTSTPEIKDGYRRQHEAMMSPAIRPMFDEWMAAMKAM